jgi:hypothetical protein
MNQDYSLSFTAASLMVHETEQIVQLFSEHQDWKIVQELVIDENILQKGTVSTRKREFAEIKKRLLNINSTHIDYIFTCTRDELKLYCLYLCSKTYKLIFEFIIEVLREKYLTFDYSILDSDYARFIEAKRANSAKLQKITEKTEYKIKQVIFKILEQANLIDSAKLRNIQKPYVSDELIRLIKEDSPKYLACYLYTDGEIKQTQEGLHA